MAMTQSENVRVLVRGVMLVLYFGRMIALVDEKGGVLWRDQRFPIFLIDYLIEFPTPDGTWN
jgi:hypothetical protein